ncbi:glycosyltransferase family 2 protein, partial [[Ruminococcus] torques]|uniref:glycosyltransferase family 2 protein n=1 Tax=[Ruminococcus] torques TaxID=33039 RepID=UPI00307A628C
MKKITIIMPVFNKEKYIRETIESVLNQTLNEFEFIIIDDGSTDKSGIISDVYARKDERIRVIHIPNGGVSNARNIGLDMAEGEYITFIDADDRVTEGYLENLYDCITNSKADMVISGYKKVWEDSDKVEISSMNILGLVEMDDILPYFAKWQKETGIFGYCWGKVFSRELCQGIYFDTSIRLAEDFDFYLKLYRRVKTIYFDNKYNYLYLQEAQNSSVAKSDYEIDYVAQLKINLRYKEFLELKNFFEGNNQKILLEKISN